MKFDMQSRLNYKFLRFIALFLIGIAIVSYPAIAQHKKTSKKSSGSTHSKSSHSSGSKSSGKKSSHSSYGSSHKKTTSSGKSKSSQSSSSHSKSSKKGRHSHESSSRHKKGHHVKEHFRVMHYTETQHNDLEYVTDNSDMRNAFQHPPEGAKPWVFWYWDQAAVSQDGITADLEAMRDNGIGGAYLMTIKGVQNNLPLISTPIVQLTPQWWQMVKFAMSEADRVGIKLALHDCDGFAVAGGPWITPELSMQKITWSQVTVPGNTMYNDTLPKPASTNGYYQDIAVYAYPLDFGQEVNTDNHKPHITTNKAGADVRFLATIGNKKSFSSDSTCWIQYAFDMPFTCRSITIHPSGGNYEAQRLAIEVSDDGRVFRHYMQLEPPRSGWQDGDAPNTYAIKPVTAMYYRFVYEKAGTEPGAEDLEAAKWKPNLKLSGIEMSSEARINQFEGKNGEVWRVAKRTTAAEIPDAASIPKNKIIDITKYLDVHGRLNWTVPNGQWVILRMGHTSTGHTNETGGAGKGLECDKFNPEAIKLQFNSWFGEAVKQAGPDLAARVLKIFHVDSWECGSQNWSPVFADEFKKRRGYDMMPYLPAMAGVPIQSADVSEKFLHDVRQTISELLVDKFYATMAGLAHEKGFQFSAESTAPTMVGDGMLHYKEVDLPMGEFWLRSPTHDKPSDILDAVSGGHIYGKNIIQAEAFTEVRMAWDEHPGMLKTLADRNFGLGVNKFVLHVFNQNPWPDKKPGMTLDGVGLYFQRDQTWWKPGKAWVDYLTRCQTLLQMGKPVTDVAVFTGEETPRRAVLPDRLVNILPGIFGDDVVASEAKRLKNEGQPMHVIPDGVTSSANMAEPQNWVDPLRGYAYDSFNRDALLRLATVKNGRIELPGGASYGVLIVPGATKMSPDGGTLMSPEVSDKISQLVNEGATIIMNGQPLSSPGLSSVLKPKAWGRVIKAPYKEDTFDGLGLEQDMIAADSLDNYVPDISWTHRTDPNFDIYFIANQQNIERTINISLRVADKEPELWDPMTGETYQLNDWNHENGRTNFTLNFHPNGSLFIVLRKPSSKDNNRGANWPEYRTIKTISGVWSVQFDPKLGGPEQPVVFTTLTDWSKSDYPEVINYSGTAVYTQNFEWNYTLSHGRVWLDLGNLYNIADVSVNGTHCGIVWTPPYRVDITKALKDRKNILKIEVTNTWANRLIGDHTLPENKRITSTTAPYRLEGKKLLPAGLMGPVKIIENAKNVSESD